MAEMDEGLDREAWGLLLVRILVGWVFLTEGIQKFLFPGALGAGGLNGSGFRRQVLWLRLWGRSRWCAGHW